MNIYYQILNIFLVFSLLVMTAVHENILSGLWCKTIIFLDFILNVCYSSTYKHHSETELFLIGYIIAI